MVIQRPCQLDQQHLAVLLLQPDLVVFKVVDFAVGLEVYAAVAQVADSAEDSAEAIEGVLVAEEEELVTKAVEDLVEEADMAVPLMDLVMVQCLPLMLLLVLAEIEVASALAPVAMLVHLLMAVQTAQLLRWTDLMARVVGMAMQDAMVHMMTDPLTVEVATVADMVTGVIAGQEASPVVIVSR